MAHFITLIEALEGILLWCKPYSNERRRTISGFEPGGVHGRTIGAEHGRTIGAEHGRTIGAEHGRTIGAGALLRQLRGSIRDANRVG